MTPAECQRVMREIEATWLRSDRNAWTEPQAAVWLKTLAPLFVADALAALDSFRLSSKWLPSHAEFTEGADAARRRRESKEAAEVPQIAAPPDPSRRVATPEVARAWLAIIRDQLAQASGPLAGHMAAAINEPVLLDA